MTALTRLGNQFDNIFENWFSFPDVWPEPKSKSALASALGATNVRSTDGEYLIEMMLPGVRLEDVELTTTDRTMTVSAKAYSQLEEATVTKTFTLPHHVRNNDPVAELKAGILTVRFKQEQVVAKKIEIKNTE